MTDEITLYEFNSFTKDEKTEILYEYAVFLMERFKAGYKIALYQIHSFYVEVTFDVSKNAITEFQLSTNLKILDPYLSQVDLSALGL